MNIVPKPLRPLEHDVPGGGFFHPALASLRPGCVRSSGHIFASISSNLFLPNFRSLLFLGVLHTPDPGRWWSFSAPQLGQSVPVCPRLTATGSCPLRSATPVRASFRLGCCATRPWRPRLALLMASVALPPGPVGSLVLGSLASCLILPSHRRVSPLSLPSFRPFVSVPGRSPPVFSLRPRIFSGSLLFSFFF